MEDRKKEQPVTPAKSVKIKSPRDESRPGLGAKAVKQQSKKEKGIKEIKAEHIKKACYHCKSTEHLSYACKSNMNVPIAHDMPVPHTMNNMHQNHAQCGKHNCMPCTFNVIQTFVNLMNATIQSCLNSSTSSTIKKKHVRAKTASPPKVRSDKPSSKTDKSVKSEKRKGKVESSSNFKIDSGASRHLIGNKSLLRELVMKDGPYVTFGDDSIGVTKGYGKLKTNNVIIEDISYVEGLRHNLLSISQFCDKRYEIVLYKKENQNEVTCFYNKALDDKSWLWRKKLSYLNFKMMNARARRELVKDLPQMEFAPKGLCEACEMGKSKRASYKSKEISSITKPLQLQHMDLFGPVNILSLSRKRYALVIVNDFSRYTWVLFVMTKDEVPFQIIDHITEIENVSTLTVKTIRSDNGTEFKNAVLNDFCVSKGIRCQYSAPRTPRQNGVVEKKNRTLVESARTLLYESKLPLYFWAEAVSTVCYTQNRTLIIKDKKKTSCELMNNRRPTIKFFHVFGAKCYVLIDDENLGKFAVKAREWIFVGYSTDTVAAYRNLNLDEFKDGPELVVTSNIQSIREEIPESNEQLNSKRSEETSSARSGNNSDAGVNTRRTTRADMANICLYSGFLSKFEPKEIEEALDDADWVIAMQEELNQFKTMFLAFATHKNFKVFQMDVKSAFLNRELEEEEVYLEQPPGFIDSELVDFVDLLFKAVYGLRRSSKRLYETLSLFLIESGLLGDERLCEKFAKLMQDKYEMSMMGELFIFLGLYISQRKDGIFIYQSKYIKDLLKKYNLEDASAAKTPMATTMKLDVDNQFQADPRESHLIVVKRIFRYLKGTPNLGIWYPRDIGTIQLLESRLEAARFKKKYEFFPEGRRARAVIARGRAVIAHDRAGVPEMQRARVVIAYARAEAEFQNPVSTTILKGKASRLLRPAIYIHIRPVLIYIKLETDQSAKEKTTRDL
ncbi:hypothetical protein AgCh_022062 [Apium graveolens]